jgi:GNAT superfamily N-acetyltransferase
MKIINKLYTEWSSATRKGLRNLTLRTSSDMRMALASKKCDSFVAFDDNNMIVGWAIYVMEPWYDLEIPGDFSVYVRKLYRKRGIGRALIQRGVEKYGTLRIHPWDDNSGSFFSKMIRESNFLFPVRGHEFLTKPVFYTEVTK